MLSYQQLEEKNLLLYPLIKIKRIHIGKIDHYLYYWNEWMDAHKQQENWADADDIDTDRTILQKLYDAGHLSPEQTKRMEAADKKLLAYPEENINAETLYLVKKFLRKIGDRS